MSKLRYTLIAALAAPLFALPQAAMAAEATGSASATVVAPIAISETASLAFGNVAPTGTEGTVVVDPTGSRSATNVDLLGGTVSAASFTVSGSGTATYGVTLPTSATLTNDQDSTTMTVSTFTSDAGATPALSGGEDTFSVGATLAVGASQSAGTYTGNYTVSVNYN